MLLSINDFSEKYTFTQDTILLKPAEFAFVRLHALAEEIVAARNNFYMIILGIEGQGHATVSRHQFDIRPSSISIIPAETSYSLQHYSADFHAAVFVFDSDFIKKDLSEAKSWTNFCISIRSTHLSLICRKQIIKIPCIS